MRCRNNIPPLSALAFAIGLHSRLDVVDQCVGMLVDVLKQVLTSFLLSSCHNSLDHDDKLLSG